MKFKLLLIIFYPFILSAQNTIDNDEYWADEHFGKRVYINKNVTSYNFSSVTYKKDKAIKKKEFINFDNPVPSKIFITSDENKSTIRINSRYFKEDLFYEFTRIYKFSNDDGSWYYRFRGKSSCDVSYHVPKNGYNQFLFIKCLDENKDGPGLDFTMSQNEQL